MTVKFSVTVKLTGGDGNAFVIIGKVSGALRRGGFPEAADAFAKAAMDCASYDDVLRLAITTVEVE